MPDILPDWVKIAGKPHLMLLCTVDHSGMRFAVRNGFEYGEGFFEDLRDAFDVLDTECAR